MPRPDQTEKATPKRVNEARGRGQIAKSADVSGAAIFLAIVFALHFTFVPTMLSAARSFAIAISNAGSHSDINNSSAWHLFERSALSYVGLLGFAFGAALIIALVANFLQFGFLFAPKKLQPNFSVLNPLGGIKKIFFSAGTLVQLVKQLSKVSVVLLLVYLAVKDRIPMFYALAHASPFDMVRVIEDLIFGIGWRFGVILFILGIGDYFYQKKTLSDSLKMTKTEVRDEHRQQEGNPEAKSAVRNRQRAMARRRMMAAVPKATVVITNPTHFAVALEWDEIAMEAPVVTAKGADLMARRIRELAREHNIPILENPPLARTLYDKVELDSPVPPNMYAAVAQIIAFVYKLKGRQVS